MLDPGSPEHGIIVLHVVEHQEVIHLQQVEPWLQMAAAH